MILDLLEEIKIYLPKYLSDEQQVKLFDELTSFPENIDSRFYTTFLKDELVLFQGDGFNETQYPDFQSKSFKTIKGFILSNTCDSHLGNTRMFSPFITLAPIFSLKKWEQKLLEKFTSEQVKSHIEAIKNQRISQFFFLPENGQQEEMFVRFDCAFSIPTSEDTEKKLLQGRFFTLSNYGFYLLLVKLGIHLSRVQEKVDRDEAPPITSH